MMQELAFILDTETNTTQLYEHCEVPLEPKEGEEDWREKPEDDGYYRNYPSQPAPEAL